MLKVGDKIKVNGNHLLTFVRDFNKTVEGTIIAIDEYPFTEQPYLVLFDRKEMFEGKSECFQERFFEELSTLRQRIGFCDYLSSDNLLHLIDKTEEKNLALWVFEDSILD